MEAVLIASSLLLWVIMLFNLFLTLALVRRINDTRPRAERDLGLAAGEIVPNFVAQTLNGESVTRSKYAGSKLALVFISAHCAPCHDLLIQLESIASQATKAGIEVVLVSGDTLEEARNFFKQKVVNFPVLVAPRATNTFFTDYRSPGTPAYCFINADGRVHSAGLPAMNGTVWRAFDAWMN